MAQMVCLPGAHGPCEEAPLLLPNALLRHGELVLDTGGGSLDDPQPVVHIRVGGSSGRGLHRSLPELGQFGQRAAVDP